MNRNSQILADSFLSIHILVITWLQFLSFSLIFYHLCTNNINYSLQVKSYKINVIYHFYLNFQQRTGFSDHENRLNENSIKQIVLISDFQIILRFYSLSLTRAQTIATGNETIKADCLFHIQSTRLCSIIFLSASQVNTVISPLYLYESLQLELHVIVLLFSGSCSLYSTNMTSCQDDILTNLAI